MPNTYKPQHAPSSLSGLGGRIQQNLAIASAFSHNPDSEEYQRAIQFLSRNDYAALRFILQRNQSDDLKAALRQGWVTPLLCQRVLKEDPPENMVMRLLLIGGQEVCQPTVSLSSSSSLPTKIERWNLRLAAQVPSLRLALGSVSVRVDDSVVPAGSDGQHFFCHPRATSLFNGREYIFDNYLHTITHCLFHHYIPEEGTDPVLWNIACDLSAEYCRESIFSDFLTSSPHLPFAQYLRIWNIPSKSYVPGDFSAAHFYRLLYELRSELDTEEDCSPWDILMTELSREFCLDSHAPWYMVHEDKPLSFWDEASHNLTQQSTSSHRGLSPGSRQEKMLLRERSRHDFRQYLRRFAIFREETQLDQNSFDYIPYHYGLQIYGNMPLIEPLEYTESHRIEELVIAIDTSASCRTSTVRRFLSETHVILTNQENFFRRIHVHIIQCDCVIQEHIIIRSSEEWMQYIQNLTIKGRGGTDFTPVFSYIIQLKEKKQIRHLKGLLYFTDGDGVYPREAPPYETAFIFAGSDYTRYPVPPWAIPLCLDVPDYCSST